MRTVRRNGNTNTESTNKKEELKTAPGMYRVYIATDKSKASRVIYNHLTSKEVISAKSWDIDEENTMRVNVLDLLLDTLDKIKETVDIKSLESPIVIHVPDNFHQHLASETYKYWIMTESFINGYEIEPEEIDMWKELHEYRKEFDLNLMIRNIGASGKNNYRNLSGVAYVDGMCTSEAWDRVKVSVKTKIVEEEA